VTQIGRNGRGVTPEQQQVLDLRALGPVKHIPARKQDFRICVDGTVYHATDRGWRRVQRKKAA